MSNLWIIYDGRAELGDTDNASVMEAMNDRQHLKRALNHWRNHDGVLVEYDVNDKDVASNERKIGHLREGTKALLSRCAK